MHYYWLKKKWFFDIIVNNLLFAFLLTMSPYDFDLETDVNYAEVAAFVPDACEVNYQNVWGTANLAQTYDFDLDATVETLDLVSSYEICYAEEFDANIDSYVLIQNIAPNLIYTQSSKIYITEYIKEVTNDAEVCQVIEAEPSQSIDVFQIVCPLSDVGVGILNVIDFSFVDNTIVKNDIDFANSITLDLLVFCEFAISDIYVYTNNDVQMGISTLAETNLSLSNISVFFTNINARFYTPAVLELKMSNIQVENLEIYNDIEVTDYVTRFSDLDGLIVEDLTGKKFRDLRNLQMV